MIAKANKVFQNFPYDLMTLDDIRIQMREAEMSNFVDIEFPPSDASIYSPNDVTNPFGQ